MRAPGDILLISCYELGHQPFHLASLSAMLQQAGYSPQTIDSAVETPSDEVLRQATFIGISVPMHTALRLGEQIARRARSLNPAAHICLYGLYALLNADHLLQTTIDSAIGGEYETPLLKLIASLEQGEEISIPGVRTRQEESGPWIQLTSFVVPERRQLPPLERYARLQVGQSLRLAGYTETTRGCKHTCLHCPITPVYHGRFFAIPVDIVLADIRAQVERGARHITFGDPDFWNGPTHAMRIIRALHQEFPQVTFDATIKIEHLLKHRHLLAETRECGCAFIVSAVESLNDAVLEHLKKGHSASDVIEAFDLMEEVGIPLRPSLLPFSPWETLESYQRLLDFFEQHHFLEHIDPVHLSIRLLIPPGSALLETADSHEWIEDLDPSAYTYRWRHPDPRMDELQEKVAALVEEAERRKADPIETFFQAKALTLAAQGQDFSVARATRNYGPRKVLPHLTESWFC
ncbi:B12-binding domain-containing radical SAM protein [Ktedonosporobacter rubrisoli]|uniref:B12-binding domain-containing radical SAM protein n=1 Tax=Ktedonosporobacter rubrisoli TaxID=2509675 RepID=A0A4P6JRA1_KTERU|nr:CUAEP/CCAEP-tail radical SAM protein [Ktedonosporobacter rubrisoli]QBD77968.1 B12-binding domain-containing radical SAM protein [Ktedonosporobacter rubrisoli]